ncbi:outer membrane protein assembly factor BamA [Labrys monachus]|uniref:Outer membrane protein assembly factor BamA n=1 Tax=Labrys monachus TaxID=217067 RepID=A0ABU0FF33_9HYPH|nr:outer membrane protein assembly factor BamA [Labrys monachus]MDQ0393223.1 outer membrane protein insertion porin family [Labrys monachus]
MASAVYKLKLGVALAAVAVPSLFCALVASPLIEQAYAAPKRQVAARSAPIINRIVFEKNKKVNSDQLTAVIESKAGYAYNQATVNSDIDRMKEAYSRVGRSTVEISYRTVALPNNRVDLVFTVAEGVKIGIDEIRFVGNENYSDWRLKRQMATTESGWLSWLRTTDTFDPDRLANDEERLRQFYVNHGYPDFRVVSVVPSLNDEKTAYIITITVDEGRYYKFGPSSVQSTIADVNSADLDHNIESWQNWSYRGEDVDKTVEQMTVQLAGSGHPFAVVRPRAERDEANGTVGVSYVVEEGAKVYIERINIRGNTRTRDYVIRREFDIGEGDPYNKAMIDRAARRLRNLGYFQSVKITNEPGSQPDRVIVDVDVVDQSTGEFSVGGGYSTSDGILGSVTLSERNFLGRGQYVKVSAEYGQRTQGYEFSFTEPYFLGQRIAAGFDLFSKTTDADSYSYYKDQNTGGTIRLSFPVTDEFAVGVNYTLYQEKVTIPDAQFTDGNFANGEASEAIKELNGKSRIVSMVGYSLTYNTLDDLKQPSEGIYAKFKQDVAGLGGDAHFVRETVDSRYYYPLTDDFTLMARAQGGYMTALGGDKLAIVDQFSPGPDLVRGFAPGGIGPRDLAGGGKGNGLGGTTYFGGTVEVQFPIFGLPREVGLRGALFADAGTVYNYGGDKHFFNSDGSAATFQLHDSSKIRSSVGASLLWASPLGPLRFDYAFVLTKDKYDDKQAFHFGTIVNY